MEYQKMINLLDNASNQLPKFRAKNWIEINDQSRGNYNTDRILDVRPQCVSLVYVIIVMHTYLLQNE